ncbi:hypothetical protein C0W59_22110 [Photobacterium kishitanii]|uniref:hypothetical protein n=1 Tax=Photobacterium kishitanii TaxID=318456 RepID=UPI000D1797E9|nr:hypothetical protein [Photobacterium kishitanii]PSV09571.1 hypothetical protein C0W59_22110 [Photobacterium kishitanii]
MKTAMKSALLALLFVPTLVQAIGINSMIEFSKNDEGRFVITNSEDYRQFIQVAIASIEIKDGKLVKHPYTRDNIDLWSLTVRPSKAVIDPGLQKDFKVTYNGKPSERDDRDKIFQVTFVPTPYFAEGEPAKKAVQIAIGFAPIFVVPAKTDQPLNYSLSFNSQHMQFSNNGNSYIRALLDSCPSSVKGDARESCSKVVYVLAGRNLEVTLTPEMKKASSMKVELSTHHLTYKKTVILERGKTVTSQ